MKKLLTTVALVALAAAPALAQQTQTRAQRERQVAPQTSTTQDHQQRRAGTRSRDVYDVRGQYVGSDPDPTIRAQLANDPTQAGE